LKFNIENIVKLSGAAYLNNARRAFGEPGGESIKVLLETIKLIYQRFPPERLPGTLTVVIGIDASPLRPMLASLGGTLSVESHETLAKKLFSAPSGGHEIVEVASDGSLLHVSVAAALDLQALAASGIVYRWESGTECFMAKEHVDHVLKISPVLASNFAAPSLSGLEDAFAAYADTALEIRCPILKGAWEGGVDGPRLVLANKPESVMRDSLVHALNLLTRANARPEQNTDASKPVDIRVTWFGQGASALIEIKWIGRSVSKTRDPSKGPTYLDYRESRAQEGADQLADYMDRERVHSDSTAPRGYLVVFDARRRNVQGPHDRLARGDALYYAKRDVEYDPDHSKTRRDFNQPVRFFMNPRESYFVA
jgi:hypothetical protein